MRTSITAITCIFIGLLATTSLQAEVDRGQIPARGAASSVPAEKWDAGMLSGNGRMGVIAYGPANSETLVFNHALLYLPIPRLPVIDIAQYWPETLRLMREKGHKAAMAFSEEKAKQQGYVRLPPGGMGDPYHLAFTLKVETPISGTATNYLQTTDFETGQAAARWKDDQGGYVRRLFVSRPDNVAVVSIARLKGAKVNVSLTPVPVRWAHLKSQLKVEKEWVTYHTAYTNTPGGYDNVVRVVAKGGKVESDGKKIVVTDADELLLLVRVEAYDKLKDGSPEAIKSSLAALPADYETLLKPHAAAHGEIFNRVRLDIGGGADRKLTSEELLARAKGSEYKKVPVALIEKLYDASRYFFISSAGLMPPNLQGIWNGKFLAPWLGAFTTDLNVELAMDSALSGNMKEGMEGYFRWIDAMLPDWRLNAKRIFGARGIMVTQHANSAQYGLNTGNPYVWSLTYWTAGAGWLASYYYDYYLFTGDKKFLAERAVPFMKEAALFYEDFLSERDAAGHILYRPSFSPEVGDFNMVVHDNSLMDIAVAKELLTNLIASCQELQIEKENVAKWQTMLKALPPYGIGPKGDLAEWADNKRPFTYNHRSYSPFYPLFRSFEFTPEGTPELWNAAKVSLQMKSEQWLHNPKGDWVGIPFGRMFHAQVAAYLGQGEVVEEILNALTDRLFPNMFLSTREFAKGGVFGFDGHGAYPDVINRSLAFSLRGTLDLLRSVPPGWTQGTIRGIMVRGQIKIDSLQWDLLKGTVEVELTSAIDQTITLRLPGSADIAEIKVAAGDAMVSPSPMGANARTVKLPAGRKIRMEIKTIKFGKKPIEVTAAPVLNAAEFRDKVLACWVGKNIGGTLGAPFEGKRGLHDVTYYTRIKEGDQEYLVGWNENERDKRPYSYKRRLKAGAPIPNDDLDLQLVWLQAMEEHQFPLDACLLGDYWLKYVRVDWAEYGVGKKNFKLGIMPPLSGHYDNRKFRDSNGAWIRSEIWACLAPGNPKLAATFSWNDASFDHGCAEGTYASVFMAVVESAAFVEKDKHKLIQLGLSAIPADCCVARAVRVALAAQKAGKTWQQARQEVHAMSGISFFPAPRGIGFTLIGWLYGEDDLGKSLCIAVNCGDDTDCTAAALGALLGIIHGTGIMSDHWRAPIGDSIETSILQGFTPPPTVQALTDRVVAGQRQVAGKYNSPLQVADGKTCLSNPEDLLRLDKAFVAELWSRSPYQVSRSSDDLTLACDYVSDPEIKNGTAKTLKLTVINKSGKAKKLSLSVKGLQNGYALSGVPAGPVEVGAGGRCEIPITIAAEQAVGNAKCLAEVDDQGKILSLQIGLVNTVTCGKTLKEGGE